MDVLTSMQDNLARNINFFRSEADSTMATLEKYGFCEENGVKTEFWGVLAPVGVFPYRMKDQNDENFIGFPSKKNSAKSVHREPRYGQNKGDQNLVPPYNIHPVVYHMKPT